MRLAHFSGSRTEVTILVIAGFLGLGTGACSDEPTGVHLSSVRVLLTGTPSDVIASADVWISRVYLESDDDLPGGGVVDLFNDPDSPQRYDLLTLRDGVTADLTDVVDVDVGLYGTLRLVVDSARVTLVEGLSFEDGTEASTLRAPGGSTSGIKVLLDYDLETVEGEITTVTVDFDVDENFVIQGNHAPRGVRRVLFTPLLREFARYRT